MPVQIPIGVEDGFQGVVDLIEQKAIYWKDDLGEKMDVTDIPEELSAEAGAWRERMIEKACENDDALMDKYINGEDISNEEIRERSSRQAV